MEQVRIRLQPQGRELLARRGSPLKDVLNQWGVEFPCGGRGNCGKCAVRILEGEVRASPEHLGRLAALGLDKDYRLSCQSRCDQDLVVEVEQFHTPVLAGEAPFDFTPGSGLGIAVDLGTTTLAAQLVDLETGRILAIETSLNPQKSFGHDLITRLEYAMEKGSAALTAMIRERIGSMAGKLLHGRYKKVSRMVIVGNTVMQHLFNGSGITSLSFFPFQSPELGERRYFPEELGWDLDCPDILFYPSIGGFVGSDILSGILATGMHASEKFSVLIDLGTNGEIVAGNREELFCSSTAAGPAFEGARISSGMLASTGAIASVRAISGTPSVSVIGDVKARGICGSGLIDAVGVMLQEGLLGRFGEILSGETSVGVSGKVSLTAKDIQEFLLAKAAIAAGTEILLGKLDILPESVERVFIAGAFGNYINPENVRRTGMLRFSEDRIRHMGNTSLAGARMFLFMDSGYAEDVLRITRHVSLESDPGFQDIFIGNMVFDR